MDINHSIHKGEKYWANIYNVDGTFFKLCIYADFYSNFPKQYKSDIFGIFIQNWHRGVLKNFSKK